MDRYRYEPLTNSAVVAAVRTAFFRSKNAPTQWAPRQDSGRLDPRQAWRVGSQGRRDVFLDAVLPGATKVNVHILVDGSGSMGSIDTPDYKQWLADNRVSTYSPEARAWREANPDKVKTRIHYASDITATLVEAFRSQPQVRLSVWMHNTGTSEGGDIAIYPIITKGRGRENIGLMPSLLSGGNGDSFAIKWVANQVKHDHRSGEQDLFIIISDGLPSWMPFTGYYGEATNAVNHVRNVVDDMREQGIEVLSVAIEPNKNQVDMYTEAGVIPFDGVDWNGLAVKFGTALGRALANGKQEARRHRR